MQSQPVLLGGEGIRLTVQLQLLLGRIDVAREQLQREDWKVNRQNLGYLDLFPSGDPAKVQPYRLPTYAWLLLCAEAADGAYEQAGVASQMLFDDLIGAGTAVSMDDIRYKGARVLAAEVALSSDPRPWFVRRVFSSYRLDLSAQFAHVSSILIQQTDLLVLTGLLSLEQGAIRSAEDLFERAIILNRLGSAASQVSAGQPLAKAYLQILRDARR